MALRVVFMGTPDFAVPSLQAIAAAGHRVVAVVTAPDKPAGRGLQLKASAVKEAALALGIPVLQPEKLRDPNFLETLASYGADIQIVVAFRMLPEAVWNMPPLGTWNLHASLLPQYRGAAPIHHAVINGEKQTGLSTFKLVHAIDEGAIALQETLTIDSDETTGMLHDRMAEIGAHLLVRTLSGIESGTITLIPQEQLQYGTLKMAPKLDTAFCRIHWDRPALMVHNHIRGLNPFPGAHTVFAHDASNAFSIKIYRSTLSGEPCSAAPGTLRIVGDKLWIACADAWLEVLEVQQSGKKRLQSAEFLRGFRGIEMYRAE